MQAFTGLTEDAYRFFWELAFQNTHAFYEENRGRYEEVVKKPLLLLAEALADTAKQVDPSFNMRPSSVLSRIRRDTRYSKDKPPFGTMPGWRTNIRACRRGKALCSTRSSSVHPMDTAWACTARSRSTWRKSANGF